MDSGDYRCPLCPFRGTWRKSNLTKSLIIVKEKTNVLRKTLCLHRVNDNLVGGKGLAS